MTMTKERIAELLRQASATPEGFCMLVDIADVIALAERALQPEEGQIVSVDVSTGDHDAGHRIFGRLTGELGSDGKTWLAEMTEDNASQLALPAGRHEELLSLHRKLAAETLRADQGWTRYESANVARNRAESELAERAGALPAGPVPDDALHAGPEIVTDPVELRMLAQHRRLKARKWRTGEATADFDLPAQSDDASPAVAQPVAEVDPHSFVQPVPDHCDRITWRNRYYHLPLNDGAQPVADELEDAAAFNTMCELGAFVMISEDEAECGIPYSGAPHHTAYVEMCGGVKGAVRMAIKMMADSPHGKAAIDAARAALCQPAEEGGKS